ncbi:MAG: hypothetical protein ACFCUL_13260 [Flavobacteriaceae bacterium]
MTNEKCCPVCGELLKGRSDKKFCSTKCKSIDQYENRQVNEAFFLQVERTLRTNRKLLKRHNRSGFTTIRTTELLKEGFDPNFFTHFWKNQKGEVYLFVYEFGFLKKSENGKDKYVLVTWQPYMKNGPKG